MRAKLEVERLIVCVICLCLSGLCDDLQLYTYTQERERGRNTKDRNYYLFSYKIARTSYTDNCQSSHSISVYRCGSLQRSQDTLKVQLFYMAL